MTGRACDDDGAAGSTLLLAALVFVAVGLAGLTAVGDLTVTATRARTAADAAALAAAGTSPLVAGPHAEPPRAAAGRAAAANHAVLEDVDASGWPLRYGVTVTVAPATPWVARLVGPVAARANAGVRPRRELGAPRGQPVPPASTAAPRRSGVR